MNVTISEPSATIRHLDVEVPQENVKEAFESKIKKYSKQIKMNGFRPGKVPRNIILARFGDSIRSEAVEETMDTVIRAELEKASITPVTQGEVQDFKDDKKEPITFKVVVEVDPEIDVKDYANLGVRADQVSVEKDVVDAEIEKMKTQLAEEKELDRPAADGDVVRGTYLALAIDGEDKEVPENPEFRVILGASATPDFDKGLVGLSAGEEKEIEFTFPADYEAVELQNKAAKYKLKVAKVAELVIPEVNEELAKKLGAETVEELTERIEKNLENQLKAEAFGKAHEAVIDILLERNEFEVPEARIKQYAQRSVDKNEISAEEIETYREEAVREIRKFRILDFISKKEKIKVKQAEVDAHIAQMAGYYGIPFEDLKQNLRQSGRIVTIREELKLEKTLNFLIGEVKEEESKED